MILRVAQLRSSFQVLALPHGLGYSAWPWRYSAYVAHSIKKRGDGLQPSSDIIFHWWRPPSQELETNLSKPLASLTFTPLKQSLRVQLGLWDTETWKWSAYLSKGKNKWSGQSGMLKHVLTAMSKKVSSGCRFACSLFDLDQFKA